ncbi:MAG: SDR family oxidoreductase [Candidatus Muiribacteriota bacterium]
MKKRQSNIILIGSTGGIGSYLNEQLKSEYIITQYSKSLNLDISVEQNVEKIFKNIENEKVIINCCLARLEPDNNKENLENFLIKYYKNNFFSTVYLTEYALKNNFKGKLINFSSIAVNGLEDNPHYAGVKSALEAYLKSKASELLKNDIESYIIRLGPVDCNKKNFSKQLKEKHDKLQNKLINFCSKKEKIRLSEIHSLTEFLINKGCLSLCGSVIHLDGGYGVV